jgi:PEP-CTERM putative exosortase interaction domain
MLLRLVLLLTLLGLSTSVRAQLVEWNFSGFITTSPTDDVAPGSAYSGKLLLDLSEAPAYSPSFASYDNSFVSLTLRFGEHYITTENAGISVYNEPSIDLIVISSTSLSGSDFFGVGDPTSITLTFGSLSLGSLWGDALLPADPGIAVPYNSNFKVTFYGDSSTFLAGDVQIATATLSSIPEPATYAVLLGAAVLGLAVVRRRKSS